MVARAIGEAWPFHAGYLRLCDLPEWQQRRFRCRRPTKSYLEELGNHVVEQANGDISLAPTRDQIMRGWSTSAGLAALEAPVLGGIASHIYAAAMAEDLSTLSKEGAAVTAVTCDRFLNLVEGPRLEIRWTPVHLQTEPGPMFVDKEFSLWIPRRRTTVPIALSNLTLESS
jgi:hypothetical protein